MDDGFFPVRRAGLTSDRGLVALVAGGVVSVAAVVAVPPAAPVGNALRVAVWFLAVWLCRQVAGRPHIAAAARRFWRTCALTALLLGTANLLRLVAGAGRPAVPVRAELASSVLGVTGVAALGWAMLAFPLSVTGAARVRLRLDVTIVMGALAVAAWYLCLPRGSPPENGAQLAVLAIGCVLVLFAAFGAVKLLLSGSAPFVLEAGMLLGAAVLVGAWTMFNLLSIGAHYYGLLNGAQLATAILCAIAARVQYLRMRSRLSGLTEQSQRTYSRLPYLAVAATQVMLLFQMWREGLTLRGWGMVLGACTVAILAMVRQHLAFREIARLQEQLRHEATHDHLTGLPNRALLNERAQEFIRASGDPERHEAVLLLDLDDFKAVNDELGHHVGDRLLVAVADRLRACVRPTDTVARLGGDEFVVLLAGTSADGAVATARRILVALSEPLAVDGHEVVPGASIGVAVGPGEQFDALLRDADMAMYQAKPMGGASLHVIDRTGRCGGARNR
ncbi:GGDEF domain-containing protein [Catellatospora tritici]|uniref:GGDEF domain-containing protein n=1 Tax=Catellatospora tritici TaxID=2851566 RepID=UPI001C2D7CB2|nr:GGDEF domain-containing protein [Catellatospora tritici]MBV1853844.1 GGDEF domain-containing protein [Catellatospora tritici]